MPSAARLPKSYVARHVELGWAVTGYGTQGITTDHAIAVVEPSSTRAGIYVAMTRGRGRQPGLDPGFDRAGRTRGGPGRRHRPAGQLPQRPCRRRPPGWGTVGASRGAGQARRCRLPEASAPSPASGPDPTAGPVALSEEPGPAREIQWSKTALYRGDIQPRRPPSCQPGHPPTQLR